MGSFVRGLAIGAGSLAVMVLAAVWGAVDVGASREPPILVYVAMYAGMLGAIAAPLFYWLLRPAWRLLRRSRARGRDLPRGS